MRWLSFLVLVIGLAALGVSAWMWQDAMARSKSVEEAERELKHRDQSLEEKARPTNGEKTTEAALKSHEQSLVEKHRPIVVKLCRMFGISAPSNARTMDELMGPLEGLAAGLSK